MLWLLNLHPHPNPPQAHLRLYCTWENRRRGGWGSEGSSQHWAAHTCPRTKTSTPVGAEVGDEDRVVVSVGGLQRGSEVRMNVTEIRMVTKLSAWRHLRGCVCVCLKHNKRGKWMRMCWALGVQHMCMCVHFSPCHCLSIQSRCALGSIVIQLDLSAPLLAVSYLPFEVWEVFHPVSVWVNIPAGTDTHAHTKTHLHICTQT